MVTVPNSVGLFYEWRDTQYFLSPGSVSHEVGVSRSLG